VSFSKTPNSTSPKDECHLKTHKCMFVQISQETICHYLLIIYIKMFESINSLHKNVRIVFTYVYQANRPLAKFSWLCYMTLYKVTAWKFQSTMYVLLVLSLFKVKAFPLKRKIKAIFSNRSQLFVYVARRHVCFVLKQSVTVTSLNYKLL
jgi:hypothetical protein